MKRAAAGDVHTLLSISERLMYPHTEREADAVWIIPLIFNTEYIAFVFSKKKKIIKFNL